MGCPRINDLMKSLKLSSLSAIFIFSLFILSSLALATGSSIPLDSPSIKVTPNYQNPGTLIPADFLGLSCSAETIADKDAFVSSNSALKNLLANLGAGTLRLGGSPVDRDVVWSRTNKNFADYPVVISPADFDRLFNFTKLTDWKIILGLNLKINDSKRTADEALYASQKGGESLIAFEIGNEPDLFVSRGYRPPGWGVKNFENEFDSYVAAIHSKVPNARFVDPAMCCNDDFFNIFLADKHAKLLFATYHIYPLSASQTDPTSPKYATISNLLSNIRTNQINDKVSQLVSSAKSHNISLRIAETNSASSGGKNDVSNVFASSLWGADYLFNLAERGVLGVNFHIGEFNCRNGTALYTPFCQLNSSNYKIRPLYYAMLLFSLANHGYTIPTDINDTSLNIAAHSVLGNDGKMYVALINKNATHSAWMQIYAGSSYIKAKGIRLTAPALDSKNRITLANSSVASNGTWSVKFTEDIPKENGLFKVALPAASAVLVTIEKSTSVM